MLAPAPERAHQCHPYHDRAPHPNVWTFLDHEHVDIHGARSPRTTAGGWSVEVSHIDGARLFVCASSNDRLPAPPRKGESQPSALSLHTGLTRVLGDSERLICCVVNARSGSPPRPGGRDDGAGFGRTDGAEAAAGTLAEPPGAPPTHSWSSGRRHGRRSEASRGPLSAFGAPIVPGRCCDRVTRGSLEGGTSGGGSAHGVAGRTARPFLRVEEAARLLRISRTSAYALANRWLDTGGAEGLPALRFGRSIRIPTAAIERIAFPDTAPSSTPLRLLGAS
jgi:excisionase family DNA binding protein